MINFTNLQDGFSRLRQFFKTRDFIFHDGRDLRRFSIAGRTQAALAVAGAVTLGFSAYGVAQAGVNAVALSGLTGVPLTPENAGDSVRAEMLVAADGQPLALRLSALQ